MADEKDIKQELRIEETFTDEDDYEIEITIDGKHIDIRNGTLGDRAGDRLGSFEKLQSIVRRYEAARLAFEWSKAYIDE